MAGKPREDRKTIKKNFVGIRLTDGEMQALTVYVHRTQANLAEQLPGVQISPASVAHSVLRHFLIEKLTTMLGEQRTRKMIPMGLAELAAKRAKEGK